VQRAGVLIGTHVQRTLREHRARVEAGVHLHDRDAGLAIAGEERALDRRGTTPARQQRSVNVPGTTRSGVKRGLRQKQSVGSNDQGVRTRGPDALDVFGAELVGLVQFQPALQRVALDRARYELQSASCGAVWLRQYECDVMSGFDES